MLMRAYALIAICPLPPSSGSVGLRISEILPSRNAEPCGSVPSAYSCLLCRFCVHTKYVHCRARTGSSTQDCEPPSSTIRFGLLAVNTTMVSSILFMGVLLGGGDGTEESLVQPHHIVNTTSLPQRIGKYLVRTRPS